jgi:hypothetical protein
MAEIGGLPKKKRGPAPLFVTVNWISDQAERSA